MISPDSPFDFKMRRTSLHSSICLTVSVLYGLFFATIANSEFKDFNNYLNYADSSFYIFLKFISRSFVDVIFNEPLWLASNMALKIFLGGELSVRFIIFCSMSAIAFLILKHNPKHFFWICLILIHPQVVKNGLLHVRQGLAIAVFLIGWYSISPKRRFLLLLIPPFIHSSFFILLVSHSLVKLTRHLHFSHSLIISFTGILGLLIGISLPLIAMSLGARQGSYEMGLNISGFGFLFWSGTFAILISGGREFIKKYLFEISLVTLYLSLYWTTPFSARVLESGLVLVLASGLYLAGIRRYAFLSLLVFGIAYGWFMRIGQPLLGFGI